MKNESNRFFLFNSTVTLIYYYDRHIAEAIAEAIWALYKYDRRSNIFL